MAGCSRRSRGAGRVALVGLVVLLGAVGCGSDGDEDGDLTSSAEPTSDSTAGTGSTVGTGTEPAETVTFRPTLEEIAPTGEGAMPSIPPDRLGPVVLDGDGIVSATAVELPGGDWEVALELAAGPGGIQAFNAMAADCVQRLPTCPAGQVAIVVDGEVVIAPMIQTDTFERDAIQISTSGDRADAEALAAQIAAAAHGG